LPRRADAAALSVTADRIQVGASAPWTVEVAIAHRIGVGRTQTATRRTRVTAAGLSQKHQHSQVLGERDRSFVHVDGSDDRVCESREHAKWNSTGGNRKRRAGVARAISVSGARSVDKAVLIGRAELRAALSGTVQPLRVAYTDLAVRVRRTGVGLVIRALLRLALRSWLGAIAVGAAGRQMLVGAYPGRARPFRRNRRAYRARSADRVW